MPSAHTLGTLQDGFRAQVPSKKQPRLKLKNPRGTGNQRGGFTCPGPHSRQSRVHTYRLNRSRLRWVSAASSVQRGEARQGPAPHTPPRCRPWPPWSPPSAPAAPVISGAPDPADPGQGPPSLGGPDGPAILLGPDMGGPGLYQRGLGLRAGAGVAARLGEGARRAGAQVPGT